MAWFIVDDKFHSSVEVMSIPREHRMGAIGLWTLSGAWSADHLKDGFVPLYLIDQLGATIEQADALVRAKLWTKTRQGYQFRNWPKWQRTRAEVEAKQKAERDRKAAYRARTQGNAGSSPVDVPRDNDGIPPLPSQPIPALPSPIRDKRGSRIPDDFDIDDLVRQWSKTTAPAIDVDEELDKFRDYWKAVAGAKGVKLDWPATWRSWVRNAQKWAVRDGWTPQRDVPQGQEWLNR